MARTAATATVSSHSSKGTGKIKCEILIENERNREALHRMGRKNISIAGEKEGRSGGKKGRGRERKNHMKSEWLCSQVDGQDSHKDLECEGKTLGNLRN